jgi:hypothetical protein
MMDVEWVVLVEPEFIPMAALSKAWVCGLSFAGISGSNPAHGLGCLTLVSVVCCSVASQGILFVGGGRGVFNKFS